MITLGHIALIRLAPLARALRASSGAAYAFLSGREIELWERCVTAKRQAEFLGGRIAAKLAVNLHRAASDLAIKHWSQVEIYARPGIAPSCRCDDGACYSVSISHAANSAIAIASTSDRAVAIDVEDSQSRVRSMTEMFHVAERSGIRDLDDACARWTLKEVCAKLAGTGLRGRPHEIATCLIGERLVIVVPSWMTIAHPCILATSSRGSLIISIGLGAR